MYLTVTESRRILGVCEILTIDIWAALRTEGFEQLSSDEREKMAMIGETLVSLLIRGTVQDELTFLGACTDADRDSMDKDMVAEYCSKIIKELGDYGYIN